MMGLHWTWGLSTAILLTIVIWMNVTRRRTGWLLGALVQLINIAFGLTYVHWTFAFLALPLGGFLWGWWYTRPTPPRPRPSPSPAPPLPPEQMRAFAEALKLSADEIALAARAKLRHHPYGHRKDPGP